MSENRLSLIQARYGTTSDAPTTATAPLNDVLASLLSHRSVRAYLPDPLAPGTLEQLVAAAQSASTSSNLQAWSVVAVEDKARKARLAVLARDQKHINEAPVFLVWIADLSRLRRVASTAGFTSDGLNYLESFVLAVIDASLAAQNATVAAESFGLGTVYIGAIRNEPEKVAAELNLPPGAFPIFGLVVGKPDPARPASVKPRLRPASRDLSNYVRIRRGRELRHDARRVPSHAKSPYHRLEFAGHPTNRQRSRSRLARSSRRRRRRPRL